MHKLTGGKVPKVHDKRIDADDKWIISEIEQARPRIEVLLEEFKFREAQFEIMNLARKGNQYLQKKEPWKKAAVDKNGVSAENQELIDNALHYCLQLTANLAIYINPFLPNTAKKMIHMMKVVEKMLDWENAGKIKLLSVGYSLRAPEILFRKIEDDEIKHAKQ
jgi:methionyl-tRNA synthetase